MALIGRNRGKFQSHQLPEDIEPGDYWQEVDENGIPNESLERHNLTGGIWWVVAPMSYGYAIGRLTLHTVRKELDGTISVRPNDGSSNSVLITGHRGEQWHGYIEHGIWESV
jgi:hypothetical protein